MPHGNRKVQRQFTELAAKYGLEFEGITAKGHFRWRHKATGRILTSVSDVKDWRAIANVERSWKQRLRDIGALNGSDGQD